MPLSAYDQSKLEARTHAARNSRRRRTLASHRGDVEKVQGCQDEIHLSRELVERYDAPDGEFRDLVEEQHDTRNRQRVFWLAVLAYVVGEYFVAGNVAEWLATEILPMIRDLSWKADGALADADSSGVPLWLRRAVGVGFVGIMLAGTLVLKFLTHWCLTRVRSARQALLPGQHGKAAFLAAQATGLIGLKVVFLLMVAGLYLWLFGFSQERAEFVSLLKEEQTGVVDPLQGFEIDESGNLRTQDELPRASGTSGESATGGSMAYATAVCYVMCWCIHGLLLGFPVHGFSKKLRYARFDREDAIEGGEEARRERVRLNRQILERIDEESDPEIKEALVRAVQPIRHLIMEDAGQDDADDNAPGAVPVAQPISPRGGGPGNAVAAEEPALSDAQAGASPSRSNVFELLFGNDGDGDGRAA